MKIKAEKEWLVVCPKCNEEYHLSDEEFSGDKTEWSCFKCGLEFEVWRDDEEGG